MSFECPYFLEDKCKLQNGLCHPAKGKCILKGKVHLASEYGNDNSEKKD
jgi:hypothetical protein